MKRHSSEGARIVSKFGRLRECVPIIRHHHERWDGAGYPERLAGEDIPLLAAIVGFAEAWDAMTIERPASARSGSRRGSRRRARSEARTSRPSSSTHSSRLWRSALRTSAFPTPKCSSPAEPYGGRMRTMPAAMSAPLSPFRCSMRQIALRGSPA